MTHTYSVAVIYQIKINVCNEWVFNKQWVIDRKYYQFNNVGHIIEILTIEGRKLFLWVVIILT